MPDDPQERDSQAQPPTAAPTVEAAQVTLDRARDAIARAQRLVGSRPEGEFPLAWCIEAMSVGDLAAVASLLVSSELRLERVHSALSVLAPDTPLTVTVTVEPVEPQTPTA